MEKEQEGSFRGFSKPYMRLHEEEEAYARRESSIGLSRRYPPEVTLDADESQSPWGDPDVYRFFHVERFFDSLEGFLTGSLDLTGRHSERFESLLPQLSEFMQDLSVVINPTREVPCQGDNSGGHSEMNDKDVRDFRLKWKLPRLANFEYLLRRLEGVLELVRSTGCKPKLQRLCLMDLPSELLDQIFSYATLEQARLLAATCKSLHAIGVPYLFHTRDLAFGITHECLLDVYREGPEDSDQRLLDLAAENQKELLLDIKFLLSRSDIINGLQTLSIRDLWRMKTYLLDSFHPSMLGDRIYAPIYHAINDVLSVSKNLVKITVCHFVVTADWLRALSQLEALHHVNFHCASIQDEGLEADICDGRLPLCNHVENLGITDILIDNDGEPHRETIGDGLWYTILLFPALVTLNHFGMSRSEGCWIPALAIREKSNLFFSKLRRLALTNIMWAQIPFMTEWIDESRLRTTSTCNLTHLKLQMYRSIGDDIAIPLLESLQSAPLEVLVFEGIKDGSLTLISRIAQIFPDLVGLTLIRRENRIQKKTKEATWPHQSWEYANQFNGFHRLKYFEWNFAVPFDDVTPSAILTFEELASGSNNTDTSWDEPMSEYFNDTQSVTLPFAVCCPTLKVITLYSCSCRFYCGISRGPKGKIQVEHGYNPPKGHNEQDWNPSFLQQGWEEEPPPNHKIKAILDM